jgi:hypothetical protein
MPQRVEIFARTAIGSGMSSVRHVAASSLHQGTLSAL